MYAFGNGLLVCLARAFVLLCFALHTNKIIIHRRSLGVSCSVQADWSLHSLTQSLVFGLLCW